MGGYSQGVRGQARRLFHQMKTPSRMTPIANLLVLIIGYSVIYTGGIYDR